MTKEQCIAIRSQITNTTVIGSVLKAVHKAKLLNDPEFARAVFALGTVEGVLTLAYDRAKEKERK